MGGVLATPSINEVLDLLESKGVLIINFDDRANYTQVSEEGHITVNLNTMDFDDPKNVMIALHEAFHAIGETKDHKRVWLVDQREVKEELAANEFALIMMKHMGIHDENAEKTLFDVQAKLMKKIENKFVATKQIVMRAAECANYVLDEIQQRRKS